MKHSLRTGVTFGMTSGVITTLGLMVGLHSGTHSAIAVVGGVLTIAVADAFSDALGIHVAEEAENIHTEKEIWTATVSAFLAKFVVSLTFLVPLLLFELQTAVIVGVVWGLSLLGVASYRLARRQAVTPWRVIGEHLAIALLVIVVTHALGDWIGSRFG
jgi:VIT1/CCC1 family predicted Fe2+/Mn2+ transporter